VDHPETENLGLRERKKLATRESLCRAALRLAIERGLENVRVDDIAAEAGVSPRTFNNYFSSREEAIFALQVDRAERMAAALRDRPTDEPLAESVLEVMVAQWFGGGSPDKEILRKIILAPGLQGEFVKSTAATERPLADAIAERVGVGEERDSGPMVLAAGVNSAARVAVGIWLHSTDEVPFNAVLRDTLAVMAPALAAYEHSRPRPQLFEHPLRESTC
jgi:AcrR family transcriptional regulator